MKKIALYIGIAIAAIGCAKENIGEATPSSGAIAFSATVDADETRLSESDDCAWKVNDKIGIFTSCATDDKNMCFKIVADDSESDPDDASKGIMEGTTLYATETRTYYAYHPYSDTCDKVTATIGIDCTTSQSEPLLWATSVDATTASTAVVLTFKHLLSKVTFDLTVGGVDATLLGNDPTATLTGANAKANFVITGGSFSDVTTASISLTISSGKITAYMLPGDYSAGGVTLWITADDTLNNTFYYPINEEWESGKSYAYTVTVGEEPITTGD